MSLFTEKNVQPVVLYDEAGNPVNFNTLPSLGVGADRSGAIAASNQSQPLAAANANRKGLSGQNISAGDLWITESLTAAAADTPGSYRIVSGGTFNVKTSKAIYIVGATTGQKYTATEY